MSLVSTRERRSFPIWLEQMVHTATETLRRPPGSDNMELLQFGVGPRLPRKRRSNTKSMNLSACARSLFERFLRSFALL